jgi:TnpA family transposase
MAAASHGVTRDKLIWTADAYMRPETYRAALARIIGAHHALPIRPPSTIRLDHLARYTLV